MAYTGANVCFICTTMRCRASYYYHYCVVVFIVVVAAAAASIVVVVFIDCHFVLKTA